MKILDCVQGSAEWHQARCGSLGASQLADALARTKTGWGASRANVMAALIAERLTGASAESFTNAAMQRGTEKEPEARLAYEFERGVSVQQVGLILHPTITGTHASPDGLIGDDGLVEIKCPLTATHIDTLLAEAIPDKYVKQMQWQLACSQRSYCDYVSYDDRLPAEMQLFTKRLHRDDAMIAEMEREIAAFLKELDEKVVSLPVQIQDGGIIMSANLPIRFRWTGDAMIPVSPRQLVACDRQYVIGETYPLADWEDRSLVSHNHQFAWLAEAWNNLPEDVADQYPTPEHLRKRALIQAGYYDEQIIDAGTKAGALRVASGIQCREPFSLIIVRGALVIIKTAKSQSRHAMKASEFQDSKTKVMEIVASMIGVSPEELTANAERAA